jgi:hypothetical protein
MHSGLLNTLHCHLEWSDLPVWTMQVTWYRGLAGLGKLGSRTYPTVTVKMSLGLSMGCMVYQAESPET